MKTAIEILSQPKYKDPLESQFGLGYWKIIEAMQEYADQQNASLLEEVERLKAAINKVIEFNLQHAQDQYGNRNKAENWACVKTLRNALNQYKRNFSYLN